MLVFGGFFPFLACGLGFRVFKGFRGFRVFRVFRV